MTDQPADARTTMRAARVHEFGSALRTETVPGPQAGPDQAVVELHYSGVNPLDIWVSRGTVGGGAQHLPFIPGSEGSGMVDGRPVLVVGHGIGVMRDGTYAQRVAVPRAAITPLPEGIDLAQAAAMGVAGVTAWRTAHDLAQVGRDDRVVVLGASGGVGSLIIQVARAAGATVWGQTGSQEKAGWIEGQGADRALVASADQLVDALKEYKPTIIFDPLGDGFTAAAIEALQPFGKLIVFGTSAHPQATIDLRALYRKGLTVCGYGGIVEPPERVAAGLQAALGELAARRLRVPVDAVLPLEQANEALQRILDRQVRGKLLLSLR